MSIMSIDGTQEQFTQASDVTLRYESPFAWQNEPLVQVFRVEDAEYPPLVDVRSKMKTTMFFPQYDMLVQEPNKPALLFSGAHNRLLYEMIGGNIIEQNFNRVLVLIDEHDDFFLGSDNHYNPRNIHIGNWGASGVIQRQWNEIVHLARKYSHNHDLIDIHQMAIPLGHVEKLVDVVEVDLVQQDRSIPLVMQLLDGKHFIYSHDADEFADWSPQFEGAVRRLMMTLCSQPGLDLIHFTPSPAYCSPEAALPQWNLLRDVYAEL